MFVHAVLQKFLHMHNNAINSATLFMLDVCLNKQLKIQVDISAPYMPSINLQQTEQDFVTIFSLQECSYTGRMHLHVHVGTGNFSVHFRHDYYSITILALVALYMWLGGRRT